MPFTPSQKPKCEFSRLSSSIWAFQILVSLSLKKSENHDIQPSYGSKHYQMESHGRLRDFLTWLFRPKTSRSHEPYSPYDRVWSLKVFKVFNTYAHPWKAKSGLVTIPVWRYHCSPEIYIIKNDDVHDLIASGKNLKHYVTYYQLCNSVGW